MRGKRAKQLRKIISFTGHNVKLDAQGRKIVSQYRRFKKLYTNNKEEMLKMVNKLSNMMKNHKKPFQIDNSNTVQSS
jgi:lauroyl/myristoyl acyltransferase